MSQHDEDYADEVAHVGRAARRLMFDTQKLIDQNGELKQRIVRLERERDELRTMLRECRPYLGTAWNYLDEYGPIKDLKTLSALMDRLDAVLKEE